MTRDILRLTLMGLCHGRLTASLVQISFFCCGFYPFISNNVADGRVDRKSSTNLISYARTRLNLFNKIQAKTTVSSRSLCGTEGNTGYGTPVIRYALGREKLRSVDLLSTSERARVTKSSSGI